MGVDTYRNLANRLDAIPNGFPATESGVELELLARIFSEEEAHVTSSMRLTPERVSVIAKRAAVDESAAARVLTLLGKRGLVRARRSGGRFLFGLRPFIVGIYEAHLPRMDAEFASLFERYLEETRGESIFGEEPPIHRIIPVEQAIPFDLEIFTYEQASRLLEEAKSWGVRDCVCRVQRRLIGKGCNHAIENCIMFAPVEGAFESSEATRAITKEEALRVLREAAQEGLVHSAANTREGQSYVCNCCTCCCGVLRGLVEFGQPAAVARSDFEVAVAGDVCTGCGSCVERCQFGALSVVDGTSRVERLRCMGCGLCVPACPTEALGLGRRPRGDLRSTPADESEWLAERARERGIPLENTA